MKAERCARLYAWGYAPLVAKQLADALDLEEIAAVLEVPLEFVDRFDARALGCFQRCAEGEYEYWFLRH